VIKVKAKPVDMCILQVYTATTEHSEEEGDDMYEKTEQFLDNETKGKDYSVVMRDLNAL